MKALLSCNKKIPMKVRLNRLITVILIPMVVASAILIGILMWYQAQYQSILSNVSSASAFNQDFKSVVDLKMFYYVSESAYSEGMPIDEVESARELAESLLQNTTEKNSIEAIESVRDLCVTLELRMQDIDDCESYDERMIQLENNIYILTDLIQTYMYNYLYYESVHLSLLQYNIQHQINVLIIALIATVIVLAGLLTLHAARITRGITAPLNKLAKRVEDISQGNLSRGTPIEASEVEIQTLSDGFEEMVDKVNALVDANKKAERRKRHAELELLQAQINPHFLYNTLDTIIWLIESDDKKNSIEMVSALSDFFRNSLSQGKDVITLGQEKNHVLSYLQIQKTRYRDRMDYIVDIPEEIQEYIIPKLTLQPLVENSIYHGIKMQREKGNVSIVGRELEDVIEITVTDTGAGMTPERLVELNESIKSGKKVGFGLRTVHERVQLLFGEEYGLTIESTLGEGTTITVTIPKQKNITEET